MQSQKQTCLKLKLGDSRERVWGAWLLTSISGIQKYNTKLWGNLLKIEISTITDVAKLLYLDVFGHKIINDILLLLLLHNNW